MKKAFWFGQTIELILTALRFAPGRLTLAGDKFVR